MKIVLNVFQLRPLAWIDNVNGLESKDFVRRKGIVEVSKGSKKTRGLKPNKLSTVYAAVYKDNILAIRILEKVNRNRKLTILDGMVNLEVSRN